MTPLGAACTMTSMAEPGIADASLLIDRTDREPTLTIRPAQGWRALNLRELWAYRELIYIFAWRDLKIRYRQTFLGVLWVIGQPLITMILFTVIFNRVARIHPDAPVPYDVFVLAGLLIWNFFSSSAARAGNSLVGVSYLISKVYFPRLVIPLSGLLVDLVDLVVSALLLLIVMLREGVGVGFSALALPGILLAGIILTAGCGLWLAALNVEYRDVRVLVPFLLQLGLYATPVAYPLAMLPPRLQRLALINPMTGVVEAFRACLFGTPFPSAPFLWSVTAAAMLLLSGLYYFRRIERLFADLI